MNTDNQGGSSPGNAAATPLAGPRTAAVVVATRFVVRRRRDTIPFLRAALASAREAEAVEGFLGGTVLADLWGRRFWTVSVWASPEAVGSYGSAPAHTEAMRRTVEWATESQVQRWRSAATQVPTLAETAARLGTPAPRRGLVRHLRPQHPARAPSDPTAPGPDQHFVVAAGFTPAPGPRHGSTDSPGGS